MFTPGHEAFWAAARKALGDSVGTRVLVEVLLLHRHLEHADVLAGVSAALSVGSVNVDVVAVEARKAAQRRGAVAPPVQAPPGRARVVSLTERRRAGLPSDDRPLPSVAAYDDLLGLGGVRALLDHDGPAVGQLRAPRHADPPAGEPHNSAHARHPGRPVRGFTPGIALEGHHRSLPIALRTSLRLVGQ